MQAFHEADLLFLSIEPAYVLLRLFYLEIINVNKFGSYAINSLKIINSESYFNIHIDTVLRLD